MLHRSASSRRRRASPSVANSSQPAGASSTMRGRRASVATEKPLVLPSSPGGTMERQRSPRGSVVPNIALDTESDSPDEGTCRRILPDPEQYGRNSLVPEASRSPRNSLIPDDYCRSPRGSLVPDLSRSPRNSLVPDLVRTPRCSLTPEVSLSPRHSLVPDSALSPRNSLVPDVAYNRSPRNSMVAIGASRTSLMPENGNATLGASRSPRHSLVPDSTRSPRGSMANLDFDRSPRGSICPDMHRTPRGSITPMEVVDRSPRGSIASECLNQSPRGSITADPNRSPRGSIAGDPNRSPRGSICPEGNRSPRGSIVPHGETNRSPRGSIGVNDAERHSRGSLGAVNDEDSRSPRGSIGPDGIDRSPRGSLGGMQDRRMPRSLNPRRASADQGSTRNRSSSPYRQREVSSGSVRSGGSGGAQVNLGYGTNAWADSRRASSSVSQLSGDESRRLCAGGAKIPEKGDAEAANLGVATYGSVVFQLKDAHLEANGICDFVFRALRVISKTMTFTICLSCLSTVPILMFIFGVQFIKECPIEPYIPVYMLIGGVLGAVRMFWALYSQIRSRRPEVLSVPATRPHVSPMKLLSIALSCFLVGWFALGHYWILHIKWPEYEFSLYAPNKWCHKTLYIFSLVHLCVVYAVLLVILLVAVGLAFCRILECPLPERYRKRQFQSRLVFLKIFKIGE
ncbi:PREDICTED: uncharacterized protein LOC106745594 [Dinoponera quadriceps]|uniref:Uncharacterized protein LOC106745594 n=1 Tax=Dinoponera quadriceps TaxID=609295 RepID=A0A6P3XEA5_DINQU|nr:PREDICTED: uncharacterized protein LOC106745594 [Dinoponera quadriceps]